MIETETLDEHTEDARLAETLRLSEESEAIEENLRDYLDQRLEPLSRSGDGHHQRRVSWFERWRVDIYFAITIGLLIMIWLRQPTVPTIQPTEPAAEVETANSIEEDVTDPKAQADESTAEPASDVADATTEQPDRMAADLPPDTTPAEQWATFIRQNFDPVTGWLQAVAEARGLEESKQVSPLQQSFFQEWAAAADLETLMESADLPAMRLCLFEYVYGRWFQAQEPPPPGTWGRVDRVLSTPEYPPEALAQIVEELGLSGRFPEPKVGDEALQVALIVAWLETHQP